ncbi:MAG: TolC family protein, partial [Candidatus Cryptobacteroides sp.]
SPVTFEGQRLNYGVSLSLLQPVTSGGRLLANIRKLESQQSVSASQEELVRAGICLQTELQYWNAVAMKEILRITEDNRNSVYSLVETIRERVDAGMVQKQDLLMMQVRLNEAECQLVQARKNYENALMAFNSIIGVELDSRTEVEDVVASFDAEEVLVSCDISSRPEHKIAQAQVDIAVSEGRIADSKYKPQIYVGAECLYGAPGYDFRPDLDFNYGAFVKMSVPIVGWGKRRHEQRSSEYRTEMAENNLTKVSDEIELEISTSRKSLEMDNEQVILSEDSLEKAVENERMAIERYDEGKASVMEVTDAQTWRQAAQLNCVRARFGAASSYAQLKKALNLY